MVQRPTSSNKTTTTMFMKTSVVGRYIFLFSVAIQGVIFRRLCSDVYRELTSTTSTPEDIVPILPTTKPPSSTLIIQEQAPNNLLQHVQSSDEPPHLQMDIMVPVYERDDRLRLFASQLGKAVADYHNQTKSQSQSSIPRISTFRLLITRFSKEKFRSDQFNQELAQLSGLPRHHIVLVHSNPKNNRFSRARALNLLHNASCHLDTCLITRLDVDMQVRPQFFQHSVETVYLQQTPPKDRYNLAWQTSPLPQNTSVAYFPIIWSTYNPESIALVEQAYREELSEQSPDNLEERLQAKLPEFSEHRGHWRPYGKGMYVILGSNAMDVTYSEKFEGWGGEDVDYYERTVAYPRRILRRMEPGLIHTWHTKDCRYGKEAHSGEQYRNCKASVRREEGSELGQSLLWQSRGHTLETQAPVQPGPFTKYKQQQQQQVAAAAAAAKGTKGTKKAAKKATQQEDHQKVVHKKGTTQKATTAKKKVATPPVKVKKIGGKVVVQEIYEKKQALMERTKLALQQQRIINQAAQQLQQQ